MKYVAFIADGEFGEVIGIAEYVKCFVCDSMDEAEKVMLSYYGENTKEDA